MEDRRIRLTVLLLAVFIAGASVVQAGINDGLKAFFPLEGNAQDVTGHGYNGTVFGNPQTVTGAVGSALRFNGNGDYVSTPPFVGQAEGSITFWFLTDQNTVGEYLSSRSLNGYEDSDLIISGCEEVNKLCAVVFDGSGWSRVSTTIQPERWYHAAFIWGTTGKQLYLDGELVDQNTNTRAVFHGLPVEIGRDSFSGGQAYNKGIIDEVRIYDRQLTPTEVDQLFEGQIETCHSERTLPICYRPGQNNTVTVEATPPAETQSWAVEDTPPSTWSVSSISHGGQWDGANHKVKWGPFFDSQARSLTYSVTPPGNATNSASFSGTMSVDGQSGSICGDTSISGECTEDPHQCDLDNDWRITINELTAYGAAWKNGDTWPKSPNPIPIDYVTNAGMLWKLGEVYHYDDGANPPWVSGGGKVMILGGSAVSSFNPSSYTPGQEVAVTIAVNPDGSTNVYAVEDSPPSGWAINNISDAGQFDSANNKVKWGPFFDNSSRTLTYTATPPGGTSGTKTFIGVVSFDGASTAITGARSISSGGGGSAEYTYWLDAAAHLPGQFGSEWRTDVVARNTGVGSANVQFKLHSSDGVKQFSNSVSTGDQGAFTDVVGLMGYEGKGCLEVLSTKSLQVSGRIYNLGDGGTFGQYIESYTPEQTLGAGESVSLLQLRQKEGEFRTNISVTNTGSEPASVKISLYNSSGTQVTQYTLNIGAQTLKQDGEPFKNRANQPNIGWGFAEVEVLSGTGILASASVVDSVTNDATTIPFKR